MSHADVTAAPFTIHLDGKDYKAKPLTGDDLGEIEEFAKSGVMSVVYKAIEANPGMPVETQSLMIDRALAHTAEMSFTQETPKDEPSELERCLSSIKGLQLILWMAIKDFHPEIKPSDLGSTSVIDMMQDQMMVLMEKSGFGVEKEGRADAPKKRRAKKSTKAKSKKRKARKARSR